MPRRKAKKRDALDARPHVGSLAQQLIKTVGVKRVLEAMSVEVLLAHMPKKLREQLKQHFAGIYVARV